MTTLEMHTDYARIESAIKYLEEHWKAHPDLETIADHIHLSPFHFERLFKRWAGVTPKQFLHFLTLQHAKSMLGEARSVLETAYASGLSSGSRLHDLFVKIEAATPGEYKAGGEGIEIRYGFHQTQFGECFIATTPRGICSMRFCEREDRDRLVNELRDQWPNAIFKEAPGEMAALIERALDSQETVLNGKKREPLRLHIRGTNFQMQVWQALLKIPAGQIVAYEDLAHAMGRPEATRAVSSAVAKNPVGYLIPCHRVIRKSGAFGKYHWGSARKKAMIGWEAAQREERGERYSAF